eukprot:2560649-Amphidinium_carterae.2
MQAGSDEKHKACACNQSCLDRDCQTIPALDLSLCLSHSVREPAVVLAKYGAICGSQKERHSRDEVDIMHMSTPSSIGKFLYVCCRWTLHSDPVSVFYLTCQVEVMMSVALDGQSFEFGPDNTFEFHVPKIIAKVLCCTIIHGVSLGCLGPTDQNYIPTSMPQRYTKHSIAAAF